MHVRRTLRSRQMASSSDKHGRSKSINHQADNANDYHSVLYMTLNARS